MSSTLFLLRLGEGCWTRGELGVICSLQSRILDMGEFLVIGLDVDLGDIGGYFFEIFLEGMWRCF